jgi:hypothetical protein
MFVLAAVIVALAAPASTAAGKKRLPVEAIMTLRSLGSADWGLDIQNSTPLPVTISRIAWFAPAGLKLTRITQSHGGRCTPSANGLQCTTHLQPPSCRRCSGGELWVEFTGTGPGRKWVKTSRGGYWAQPALLPGRAVLGVPGEGRITFTCCRRPRTTAWP